MISVGNDVLVRTYSHLSGRLLNNFIFPRGSYLYQISGESKYADRVERIAYNALPATLTGGTKAVESFHYELLKLRLLRYVAEAVPARAKSDRSPEYEPVRLIFRLLSLRGLIKNE